MKQPLKKVLAYDEELLMLDIIRSVLRYYECEYTLVEESDTFLKEAQKAKYDLILLDIDKNHKEVTHIIQELRYRSKNDNTSIIGVTASPITRESERPTTPQEKKLMTLIDHIKHFIDKILKKPFSIVEFSTLLEEYGFIKKKSFQEDFIMRQNDGLHLKETVLILEQEKNISLILESTNLYDVHTLQDSDLFMRVYHRKHYLFSTVIIENNEHYEWKTLVKNLIAISPLPSLILLTQKSKLDDAISGAQFGITAILDKACESTTLLKHMQNSHQLSVTNPRKLQMIQSWMNEHNLPCEDLLKRLLWKISMQHRTSKQNSLLNLFYINDKKSLTLKDIQKHTETYLNQRIKSSPKAKILIVEDEAYYRRVLYYLLKPIYKVYLAENTEEAKKILNENSHIHQMILDIYLPGKLGDAFFLEIKEHYPETSVLIITAYREIPKAFQLLQHGAVDYLNKPFKAGNLFKALGITWLSRRWPQIKSRPAWYSLSYWERLIFLSHLINERKQKKEPFFMSDFYALFPEALEKDKAQIPIK